MNSIITSRFGERTLATLTHDGKRAWDAGHIGDLLGYAGNRLDRRILGPWFEQLIEGFDYVVLTGEVALSLTAAQGGPVEVPSAQEHRLVLLFEPGLHIVLAKTGTPEARRLRRFVLDEVLSQCAEPPTRREPTLAQRREKRLWAQMDLEERRLASESLRRTVGELHRLGYITDHVRAVYEVTAAEIALENELPVLQAAVRDGRPPSAA